MAHASDNWVGQIYWPKLNLPHLDSAQSIISVDFEISGRILYTIFLKNSGNTSGKALTNWEMWCSRNNFNNDNKI